MNGNDIYAKHVNMGGIKMSGVVMIAAYLIPFCFVFRCVDMQNLGQKTLSMLSKCDSDNAELPILGRIYHVHPTVNLLL